LFFLGIISNSSSVKAENQRNTSKDRYDRQERTLSRKEISSKKDSLKNVSAELMNITNEENIQTIPDEAISLLQITENKRTIASLANPTMLNMDFIEPFIIAAAVTKDPDNLFVTRSGYSPLYFFYDNRGNLDYVQDNYGTKIAEAAYCDGTEVYSCPIDWVSWINFDPLGPGIYLDFYYMSDTPSTNYYASTPGEPNIYFYNINMADGTSVTDPTNPLYESSPPAMLLDFNQIIGYTGTINENWVVRFDNFQEQRLVSIASGAFTKSAIFTASTSKSIYRFFNKMKGNHFYTKNKSEKNNIRNTLQNEWNYEGVAYKAYDSADANILPLYRFWNKKTGFHFYTQNEGEKNNLINNLSDTWNYEGVAYYAYSTNQPGSIPLYRFFNKIKGNHFYTKNATEKNNIITTLSNEWNYEGEAWYVPE